jgi:peptidyl-dipeptidase Dcp
MIEAAFYTAGRLFGLEFKPRPELKLYHPDARAWEVVDKGGKTVGLFVGDYFARSSKRSGAWMSSYREQHKLDGEVRPVVVNVCNFAKASDGQPALLSMVDARTLFHEFGHALHGLLSDVTYRSLSGTSVEGDFVELPSQLYEHWLEEKAILATHARHVETGQPMPEGMIDKLISAQKFNQGFATVEYVSSALVDLDLHEAEDAADPMAMEAETLARLGMPPAVVMRHRTPHFQHVFSGDGYSAGYYSYMWSEVMDADAFRAFEEAGDIFDPGVASRLAEHVLSAGNKRDPEEAYRAFRGRGPEVEALLEKRGLAA